MFILCLIEQIQKFAYTCSLIYLGVHFNKAGNSLTGMVKFTAEAPVFNNKLFNQCQYISDFLHYALRES